VTRTWIEIHAYRPPDIHLHHEAADAEEAVVVTDARGLVHGHHGGDMIDRKVVNLSSLMPTLYSPSVMSFAECIFTIKKALHYATGDTEDA
jgi:hypothetical protein